MVPLSNTSGVLIKGENWAERERHVKTAVILPYKKLREGRREAWNRPFPNAFMWQFLLF